MLCQNAHEQLVGIETLLTVIHKAIELRLHDVLRAAYE